MDQFDKIEALVMIGVGAAFDFLSGREHWAHRSIQGSWFAWFSRLASEPKMSDPSIANT